MNKSSLIPPRIPIDISTEDPRPDVESSGFAFVINVSGLAQASSFTLAHGHDLRRATGEEISIIKELLARVTMMRRAPSMPWEVRVLSDGSVERLEEEHWRYHVISFRGSNSTLVQIEQACSLAPLELKIGFTVMNLPGGRGVILHPERLFQLLNNKLWSFAFFEVHQNDVEAIKTILRQFPEHDQRLVDVKRLAIQLQDLEGVPFTSPLRFLGYFAVLESLLTHPPKPTDPYDSITRQVKKKIKLLDCRCSPPIDYTEFRDVDKETLWVKMYQYRSALAHGGVPDFARELKMLRSPAHALELLKQTVKTVIRQALIEPQLLLDLRDC